MTVKPPPAGRESDRTQHRIGAPATRDAGRDAGDAGIPARQAGTLPGLFRARLNLSPDARAYMAYDPARQGWGDVTWREIAGRVNRFRAAMGEMGVAKGDRVALLLPNGLDWVAFDMAALSLGLVVVPLYTHDSPSNQAYILGNADVRLALIDTRARWAAIAALDVPLPSLLQVWIGEPFPAAASGVARPLADALPESGPEWSDTPARPQDLATIIYTSGTTGRPKGVMLSHAAILWDAEGLTRFVAPRRSDVFLSFLPLAHAFERTVGHYLPMMSGSTVAHARSVELLRQDLVTVRPTVFLSVPRLYDRIYKAIRDRGERSVLKRCLLGLTARIGWADFEWKQGRGPRPGLPARLVAPLLRRLVARPVLMAFGGRMRVAVSGGAPLAPPVARFLVGMGLPLVEGYGLTEAAPVVTATALEDNMPGSVGRPLHGSEIRLSEGGELLVRSPGVMQGYWKDPAATSQALSADGWLRTGDLAALRDGRVFLRGRLKEIIVLSTGENINPDPIEAAILRDPCFEQACVLGDGKPFAVAVLVLEKTHWREFAEEAKLDPAVPNVPAARSEILAHVAAGLTDFPKPAQIRGVHLVLEPWTIDDGLLTPTFKVKRHAVHGRYAAEISALYGKRALFD